MLDAFRSEEIISNLIYTGAILVIGFVISVVLRRIAHVLFNRLDGRFMTKRIASKTITLRSLVKNIMDVGLFTLFFFMILSRWGINILPLLTGAGIIGLAISFGSQTLVKDIISGFFIIVEDQYNIGDTVSIIDKYQGKVVNITLRLTELEDKEGNRIYIPNSQITTVKKLKKD